MRELSQYEVEEAYEMNTGKVIVECIKKRGIDHLMATGILVKSHGSFSLVEDALTLVYHAVVMENIAEMDLIIIESMTLMPTMDERKSINESTIYRRR